MAHLSRILKPHPEVTQDQLIELLTNRITATERMRDACFPGSQYSFIKAIDEFMTADLHIFGWWVARHGEKWLEEAKKAPEHERPIWLWVKDGKEGDFKALEAL